MIKKESKILVIPDKFKFTFTSTEISEIICNKLIKKGFKNIKIANISDGGDGFLEAINNTLKLKKIHHKAKNPIFKPINTFFCQKDETAFLEYAKTGGLELLNKGEQNPLFTSSYGLGEQIIKAISKKTNKIIIGLGGSSTNDAGIGMAAGLGYKFLDKNNNQLKPIGKNLLKIKKIIYPQKTIKTKQIKFIAATDVENPLIGKNGATYSFAKQKGATDKDIFLLEKGIKNIYNLTHKTKKDFSLSEKGDGAAGGLGFGIRFFLNGKIIQGSDYIFDLLNIINHIKRADIIITGEGKLDKTSFQGKIVGKIYKSAKKYNKKIIIIVGFADYYKNSENTKILSLFKKKPDIETAKKLTAEKVDKIIEKISKQY